MDHSYIKEFIQTSGVVGGAASSVIVVPAEVVIGLVFLHLLLVQFSSFLSCFPDLMFNLMLCVLIIVANEGVKGLFAVC